MDSVVITVVGSTVWLPDAFTPNNDGLNDVLLVRGFEDEVTNFEYSIYNQFGARVFFTRDENDGWNGKHIFTQAELPIGAYVYVVKGTDSSGKDIELIGMVNLIR